MMNRFFVFRTVLARFPQRGCTASTAGNALAQRAMYARTSSTTSPTASNARALAPLQRHLFHQRTASSSIITTSSMVLPRPFSSNSNSASPAKNQDSSSSSSSSTKTEPLVATTATVTTTTPTSPTIDATTTTRGSDASGASSSNASSSSSSQAPAGVPEFGPIPLPARLLGYAGLIPFILGGVGTVILPDINMANAGLAAFMQMTYASSIASFMGAVHWGLALAEYKRDGTPVSKLAQVSRYGLGVLPALGAWGSMALAPEPGMMVLMIIITGQFVFDAVAHELKLVPSWYMRLRTPLTLIALLSLGTTLMQLKNL